MSVDSAENTNNSSNCWGQQNSNQWLVDQSDQTNKVCGSWAQAVSGDLSSSNSNIPNNTKLNVNQNELLSEENGSQNNTIPSNFNIDELYDLKWGKSVINHDNSWIDKHCNSSSHPSVNNDMSTNSGLKSSTDSIRNNTGTELWENNLRQTKELNSEIQSPINSINQQSPIEQMTNQGDTQWKKLVVNSTHFGGTWGEEEDLSNVWTGIPNNNAANQLLNNSNSTSQSNVFRQQTQNSINCDKANSLQLLSNQTNPNKNWISDNFSNNWGESIKTGNEWETAPDILNSQNDILNSSTHKAAENITNKNWNYMQNAKASPDWSNEIDKQQQNQKQINEASSASIDDGTSLWGNPQGQNKVLSWKEENNKQRNSQAINNEQWKKNSLNGTQINNGSKNNWNELMNADGIDRAASIPGTPIGQSNNALNWNSNLDAVDDSEWAKNNKRKLTKEMIVSSSPFRILTDMGFKEEDVENSLRMSNMNLQESIEELRLNTLKETGVEIDRRKANNNVLRNNPAAKLPNSTSNLPSEKLLSHLVQQIQLAVQSGHLQAQILNQQLAPSTIQLIYQLLQQIKIMQSLQSGTSKNYFQNSYQVSQCKQKIQNLQKQINVQQSLFFKQQQTGGNRPSMPTNPTNPMLNNLENLTNDLSSLQLNQQQQQQQNQSRLNQWKLRDFSKDDINYQETLPNDFSRAPGPSSAGVKSTQQFILPNSWTNNEENWQNLQARTKDQLQSNQPLSSSAPQQFNYNELVNTTADFNANKQWKDSMQQQMNNNPQAFCLNSNDAKAADQVYNWSNKLVEGENLANASSQSFSNPNTWSFSNSNSQATNPQQQNVNIWNNNSTNTATINKPKGPPPGLGQVKSPNLDQSSSFLLIRNLNLQIDESTLKTLCRQHGPLQTFHMFPNHGLAIVKYSSKDEAIKAQSALNNCALGNTTIQVNLASEQEVQQYCQLASQSVYTNNNVANNELNDYMNAWMNNNNQVTLANVSNVSNVTNVTNLPNASTMWSFNHRNNQPNNLWNNIDQNSNLQNLLPDNLFSIGESS